MNEQFTAATAYKLPAPKGFDCAAHCGHGIHLHREHGCDMPGCDCPAPYGRILPSPDAVTMPHSCEVTADRIDTAIENHCDRLTAAELRAADLIATGLRRIAIEDRTRMTDRT